MQRRSFLACAAATVAATRRAAGGEEVVVFAAASLTDALSEIGAAFQRRSGHHVAFSFGGSGDLARQIRAGAPAQLFVSADALRVDELQRDARVRVVERVALLSNRLVVVAPASSALLVRRASDLVNARRVAIADPDSVPAGSYAREWLERAAVWARIRDRIVPTLDVRAALAAVESGSVDAGIVYRTDALRSKRARIVYTIAPQESPQIVYPAALLGSATTGGRELLAYLRSAEARAVFERLGFEPLAGR